MRPVIALVGAPNCGKTTLYNWLTGSKFKVVNYPGSTVEFAVGDSAPRMKSDFKVIDTPGTYSLSPKSADEEVTLKVLTTEIKSLRVTHAVVVLDGTQISRHLLIALQVKEMGLPLIAVVTMNDLLKKSGIKPQIEKLSKELGCPVVAFDGILGEGLFEIPKAIAEVPSLSKMDHSAPHWDSETLDKKVRETERLEKIFWDSDQKSRALYLQTEKLDRWLLHPFWGLFSFFAVMTFLFTSIYWLASPWMDLIDQAFSASGDYVLSLGPENLFFQFLGQGLIAGVGSVLVFVPQIFILFLGIGLLESSGYLARAATLIDKPFSKLGMSGRSFVPILSGFACAVPAMMATRNLSSKRDRWITNFIIPLMTCSARLPVYALLLGFIFLNQPAWKAGLALAALYFGSLILGALAASILNRILKAEKSSFFMMELPMYRLPKFKFLVTQSLMRTKGYITRAGPMILTFAVIIWWGTRFPGPDLESSYLGRLGHLISPIVEPMGVDWRVGVGMISAFAAREVFVSTMAVIFNIAGEGDSQVQGLLETMKTATLPSGQSVFTVASVAGLAVFFMVALQCMSTFAIAVRESGSYRFAVLQLLVLNLTAYVLAVVVYQTLHGFGF